LCETNYELQKYHRLNCTAKNEFMHIIAALGCEICKCPKCGFLISKSGGCDHMQCVCGEEFSWSNASGSMEKKLNQCMPVSDAKVTPKTKKTNAPSLQHDDGCYQEEDDWTFERNDDSDHEESSVLSVESVPTVVPTVLSDDTEGLAVSEVPSSITASIVDINEIQEDEWEQDYEILEIESPSGDDSVDVPSESTSSAWEELSEVSSVVSFTSRSGMTFLDAAQANGNVWKTTLPKTMTELLPIHEHARAIQVENYDSDDSREDETQLDYHSIYEGVKFCRGGKEKFMYNHQPKLKYRRYDQRKRSMARRDPYSF
jgi:hypothetical protein